MRLEEQRRIDMLANALLASKVVFVFSFLNKKASLAFKSITAITLVILYLTYWGNRDCGNFQIFEFLIYLVYTVMVLRDYRYERLENSIFPPE